MRTETAPSIISIRRPLTAQLNLDEDGLNLELKITSDGYTITDEKDNVLAFNSSGFLTSSKDDNGNTMKITFDSSDKTMIKSVTNGSGHVIKLADNVDTGSGYLQYMYDPAGRKILFTYASGRLIAVVNLDGTKDEYTYDADGSLTSAKSSTGYSLNFTYTSLAKGKRVLSIQEKGRSTNGQKIQFDRSLYNTTVIQTSGLDDVFGTSDDIYTTYQFDNFGRTVSTQSKNSYSNFGAEVYNYTSSTVNSNIKSINRVSSTAALDITNSGNTVSISSRVAYNSTDTANGIRAGAYIASTTDQDGYKTTYSYNKFKGTLDSVTDANGTKTTYTYNANNDALTSVTANGITNKYTYLNSRLASIVHNGTTYGFTYDNFGNVTKTTAGNYTLSTNTYAANNGKLSKVTYGNGDYLWYTYNVYGQVTALSKNGSTKYNWIYDASTKPIEHLDYENKLTYDYSYDTTGRLIRESVYKQGSPTSVIYTAEQSYDANNNVSKIRQIVNGQVWSQKYNYGRDNLPVSYDATSVRSQTYSYDSLNRCNKMVLSTEKPVTVDYIYWVSGRNTDSSNYYRTTKIKWEFVGDTVYCYEYDKLGNITEIDEGKRVDDTTDVKGLTTKLTYEYDALSQLTRENNKYLNQTITYEYDKGGNLTKKTVYPYTTASTITATAISTKTYSYGNSSWTDLLTSYDGKTITYDGIGNPLSYLGYTLTWNGRQLSTLKGNGVTASYKYNADGLRSYKKVGNIESTYQYLGDKLVYEKRGDIELQYGYNSYGDLTLLRYTEADGTVNYYYAVCNSRGDVEDIYNGVGELRAHYTYDSWGNVISITDQNGKEITSSTHIGILNPIRYRGYYYDAETGYYYLQSRYYNPQVGRFLNADGYISTGQGILDYNMFAYCMNNPIIFSDENGELPLPFWAENILNGTACEADYNIALQCNPNLWIGYNRTCVDKAIEIANIYKNSPFMFAEHHKRGTTNPANRNKHENANARRQRDNNGEKKNKNPSWKPNPNKRRNQNLEIAFSDRIAYGVIALGATGAVVYLLANDVTGVGVIDDAYIAPLLPIIWDNTVKCFA